VASKQLTNVDLGSAEVKSNVCKVSYCRTGTSLSPPASGLRPMLLPHTSLDLSLISPASYQYCTFHPTQVFVTAHQSVEHTSAKMAAALKRKNYVTPTNYLETVRGYVGLLSEKRRELGDKANKLKGGLEKLAETSVQVRGRWCFHVCPGSQRPGMQQM